MITIYTTTSTKEEAKKIAIALVKKKIIACANIFPIESVYEWKGKLNDESEFAVIMKTLKPFETVEREIKLIHSYDVPLIECWKTEANKEYLKWMKEKTI